MIARSPIKVKTELCIDCTDGKERPVFKRVEGKPLCATHARWRTAKKHIEEGKESKKEYDKFCRDIWKSRPHKSDLSGQRLPEYDEHSPRFCNLIRYHMHHVKPIGKELKSKKTLGITFDPSKIIFVTKQEHDIIEWGSPKQQEEIGWTKFQQNFNH